MKYHNPITRKRQRKPADQLPKTRSVPVRQDWLGDDEQQASGPRLATPALHALSRKGLWGLLLFLLAGVAAFTVQDFNLYQSFPEPVLQLLGCPPPALLIHLALTGYSFTVVVPVLIRMATGAQPQVGWQHLACRAVFYLFYLASTTLPQNFVAVTVIGMLLYAVEQVGIWAYLYKNLHQAEVSG
jgi:hypothetical protein